MKSSDLDQAQLRQLARSAGLQYDYYLKLWKRLKVVDLPHNDPLALAVCRASSAIGEYILLLESLQRRLPQPYRPLASPFRTSGQVTKERAWAFLQADAKQRMEEQAKAARDRQSRGQ